MLQGLDKKKKADFDRIYLPYEEGDRGLMSLEKECKVTMVGLNKNLTEKSDIQTTSQRHEQ